MYISNAFVLSVTIFMYLPTTTSFSLWRRADAIVPNAPKTGDTIVAGSPFDIVWTANGDRNVTISLYQGPPKNQTLAHIITASTTNNGLFRWIPETSAQYGDNYLGGRYPEDRPSSGCNYTMEFRTNGDTFYSSPFAILAPYDGGLKANCTRTSVVPQTGKSVHSTGVLAGGIAGAAFGMTLLLGVLFWVALKREWIVTGKKYRGPVEQRMTTGETGQFLPKGNSLEPNVTQIGGAPVYQMP
ncbi:hypothetical protein VTL71DRAFT_12502 [Oculimacula yallundae]|uniref:Yeast cell wall synthesis Kre9/Knh1-like N-terminal domain-containing protein n=1 Tax=Oculimacula yallundae TaxID=86028 RepID=A0ABR4CNZ9_9HELO